MLILEQYFRQIIKAKYIHMCIYMYKHISKNNSNVNLNKFCENFYLPYEEPP